PRAEEVPGAHERRCNHHGRSVRRDLAHALSSPVYRRRLVFLPATPQDCGRRRTMYGRPSPDVPFTCKRRGGCPGCEESTAVPLPPLPPWIRSRPSATFTVPRASITPIVRAEAARYVPSGAMVTST